MFTESTYECNRCSEKYKSYTGMETMAVLYRGTVLAICPACVKEVAKLMGLGDEKLFYEMAKIKELESEEKTEREMKWGDRCKLCQAKFEGHHHKHLVENYYYHSNCYEKTFKTHD